MLRKATFLGTGTSCGVPVIGCDCEVCRSEDPRNKRFRSSLYVVCGDTHIVVDTTPDFRMQMLQNKVPRIDAVLITHAHADHIFGLDDVRRFNTIQREIIPVYGSPETIGDVGRIFSYANTIEVPGVYRPLLNFETIEAPVEIGDVRVVPFDVKHGPTRTYGYMFEAGGSSLAYFPDCAMMPDSVVERLQGIDVVILDALRHRPHRTHLTVKDCLAYFDRIGAKRSFLTHMTHDLDHAATEADMPNGVGVPYDGLTIEW